MKDSFIEFAKVLKDSKNNSDNLFKLLRNLALTKPEFKNKVGKHLKDLAKHEEIITRICNLRDKYYAHLDKDYENHISPVPMRNLHTSLEAIEKALITLSSKEIFNQFLAEIVSRDEMKI